MIQHDGKFLLSVTIGLPVLVLGAIILAVAIVAIFRYDGTDRVEKWMIGTLPILALLGLVIGSAFGYWPYRGDYHRLQPATGTVATIDTRFLAASQYVVITYDTGLIVRCDDSRCATVKVGDRLRLLCTKEFEYGAVNGWGCKWG